MRTSDNQGVLRGRALFQSVQNSSVEVPPLKKPRMTKQVRLMYSFLEEENTEKLREMVQDLTNNSSDSEPSEHEAYEPPEELLKFAPKLTQNRLQSVIDEAHSKFPFKDSFLSYLRENKNGKRTIANVSWQPGSAILGSIADRQASVENAGAKG